MFFCAISSLFTSKDFCVSSVLVLSRLSFALFCKPDNSNLRFKISCPNASCSDDASLIFAFTALIFDSMSDFIDCNCDTSISVFRFINSSIRGAYSSAICRSPLDDDFPREPFRVRLQRSFNSLIVPSASIGTIDANCLSSCAMSNTVLSPNVFSKTVL